MKRTFAYFAVAASFALSLSACNHCQKLEERICADLAQDCTHWKTTMNRSSLPSPGRGQNHACRTMMNDAVYRKVIVGLKDNIAKVKSAAADRR